MNKIDNWADLDHENLNEIIQRFEINYDKYQQNFRSHEEKEQFKKLIFNTPAFFEAIF